MYQNALSYNSHLTELAQAAVADEKDSISTLLFPPAKVPTALEKHGFLQPFNVIMEGTAIENYRFRG